MGLIENLGQLGSAAPVGLEPYLVVSSALFVLGLLGAVSRRNAVGILIGIELILNAAVLNFMAFWRFGGAPLIGDRGSAGPLMGIFIIVLAACEAAVALAILLNLYFNYGSVEVDQATELKH